MAMSDVVIQVEKLGKLYRIGKAQQRHDTLRDVITDCGTRIANFARAVARLDFSRDALGNRAAAPLTHFVVNHLCGEAEAITDRHHGFDFIKPDALAHLRFP